MVPDNSEYWNNLGVTQMQYLRTTLQRPLIGRQSSLTLRTWMPMITWMYWSRIYPILSRTVNLTSKKHTTRKAKRIHIKDLFRITSTKNMPEKKPFILTGAMDGFTALQMELEIPTCLFRKPLWIVPTKYVSRKCQTTFCAYSFCIRRYAFVIIKHVDDVQR